MAKRRRFKVSKLHVAEFSPPAVESQSVLAGCLLCAAIGSHEVVVKVVIAGYRPSWPSNRFFTVKWLAA
ncbi:hypothetical protein Pint_02605 [Pistacia integerrima]|uniref:Uncharacterized protein n=1 Tax=Pistacia integerrima TaxID=434235 RepID=A0ACC0ZJB1_9ROSI|nr:hypothetical protein Pint_02605 [Pistacia integerrima]